MAVAKKQQRAPWTKARISRIRRRMLGIYTKHTASNAKKKITKNLLPISRGVRYIYLTPRLNKSERSTGRILAGALAMAQRLSGVLKRIEQHFDSAPIRVYSLADLNDVLQQQRDAWQLPKNASRTKFVDFLLERTKLHAVELSSEKYGALTRYAWGETTPYAIGLSLRRNSYLSHGTAVFLHGLTEQIPKVVYVNHEQSTKPRPSGGLNQASIDQAFSNMQRRSNYSFSYDDRQVLLLSGKQTANLGVISKSSALGETLRVTGLERTLIDIVVRPEYSGGPYQILQAYKSAKDHMSVNALLAALTKLDYVYPYHQAIGFYMERAGYESERLDRLKRLPITHDFYLGHGLRDKNYDASWRLYFPKGFQ